MYKIRVSTPQDTRTLPTSGVTSDHPHPATLRPGISTDFRSLHHNSEGNLNVLTLVTYVTKPRNHSSINTITYLVVNIINSTKKNIYLSALYLTKKAVVLVKTTRATQKPSLGPPRTGV